MTWTWAYLEVVCLTVEQKKTLYRATLVSLVNKMPIDSAFEYNPSFIGSMVVVFMGFLFFFFF